MCRLEVNWFGKVWLLIKYHGGGTYCICHRIFETLGFVRSDVALE